jgi:hypothetical protein
MIAYNMHPCTYANLYQAGANKVHECVKDWKDLIIYK